MMYRILINSDNVISTIIPHDSSITYDGGGHSIVINTLEKAKIYIEALGTIPGMPQVDTQPITDYQDSLL